ncbi:MFS transporter [Conexibacter sp. CPCC 206217]|uniref:MFS transporter n=1 Tax=Conexibacter sp. CPCC 206217 TaxID=3064574 RepID=UPI002725014A|nr:MFS transporter [Conexibacter sp. CPCC 206217]MDO8209071.1 MFS transporter [Conexibacter sp. CPCC 206217]
MNPVTSIPTATAPAAGAHALAAADPAAASARDGRRRASHGAGVWVVAYAFLVVMAYSAVPTPLYAIYQQEDGFSAFMITVIFGAYAVGVAVSLFVVGHVSDWHGRRRVLIPALLMSIASAFVFLFWHDLGALLVARVISGFAIGAVTATATAWIAELHATDRPDASQRRPQLVATAANLGGIGLGPLVSGVLAQWVGHPLTVPFIVSIGALTVAVVLVALTPETRTRATPLPRYRPQRVSVPQQARARYLSAAVGAAIAFAAFGLFTSLAPTFLAGTLHHSSRALAGAAAFAVFGAAVVAQSAIMTRSTREALTAGIATMLVGLAVLVAAVWLSQPSLFLFLAGGVLAGAGGGMLFKGVIATVATLTVPERRAEALAGIFLAGYIGLAVPVMGLGVLSQYVVPRVGLLVFAGVLGLLIVVAAPTLVGRGTRAARA